MHLNYSLFLAALASIAHAESTPRGFKPSTDAKLEVLFGSTAVSTPGQLLTKASRSTLSSHKDLTIWLNTTATSTAPRLALSNTQGKAGVSHNHVSNVLDCNGLPVVIDVEDVPMGSDSRDCSSFA